MKVSLNLVKQFVPIDVSIDELTQKIGSQLGAIESVTDLTPRYQGALIVRVVDCQKMENSDHLNICMVDDAGKASDVERNADNLVQVVCGAPNVRSGMLAVWLPPGIVVPETYDKDQFVLESRMLRGVKSNGMLASPRELALGDSHEGLFVVDEGDAQPGDAFVQAYALDDQIIDIENKMFTHRPDCFGQLGVAREIAGILGKPFTSPDWYKEIVGNSIDSDNSLSLRIRNELPDLVPRFMAIALDNIDNSELSNARMQTYLGRLGVRPINVVVDITNYLMLLTGQPLHAYDYQKVKQLCGDRDVEISIRHPKEDEKLTLINGKEITLPESAIVIAAYDTLIGVGGVMGGSSTEVDEDTKTIILECATFDMYSIRKTSMSTGIFSEAVTRFNKGQSFLQNPRIMQEAIHLLQEASRNTIKVVSPVVDDIHVIEQAKDDTVHQPVTVSVELINSRLGLALSSDEISALLQNVEFAVTNKDNELYVKAPFWRTDIEIPEDVIEEVGRLYGYDALPITLPSRTIKPADSNVLLTIKQKIRNTLSKAGANEVLNYSFVHENLLRMANQETNNAFQLSNALSPDLQYYRLSIIPSLLHNVYPNLRSGYKNFSLFEIGKTHLISAPTDVDGVPEEYDVLGLIYTTDDKLARNSGAAYYNARYFLDNLLSKWGVVGHYVPLDEKESKHFSTSFYQAGRAAILTDAEGNLLGSIGEFSPSVRQKFKIPKHTAGFELDIGMLAKISGQNHGQYMPLSRFPKVEQDICLRIGDEITYGDLYAAISQALNDIKPADTIYTVKPLDIYRPADKKSLRQITFRIAIVSYERTLTDKQVAEILNRVSDQSTKVLKTERV